MTAKKLFYTWLINYLLLFPVSSVLCQVSHVPGAELGDNKNRLLANMIGCDETGFYAYRVRSKGRGTSFFIQKIDKASLKEVFNTDMQIPLDNYGKVVDAEFSGGNVYVFFRRYYKERDVMTLYYRKLSQDGVLSPDIIKILDLKTDHYEFADFDVIQNPSKTKFLIKASYKSSPEDHYRTNFMLLSTADMKTIWNKSVERRLFKSGNVMIGLRPMNVQEDQWDFLGFNIDNDDNIYYGVQDRSPDPNDNKYYLKIGIFDSKSELPKEVELKFEDDYLVGDIEYLKTNNNQVVVGGFLKDVIERRGRDWMRCGIFSFTIDLNSNTVSSHSVMMFDDKLLYELESSIKKSRDHYYKMDYIFANGSDTYFVGEQYIERYVSYVTSSGNGVMTHNYYWEYMYMDVIIGKMNEKGEFEWIRNIPMRNYMKLKYPHVFKEYGALMTDKNIYILRNSHPDNFELIQTASYNPDDLKPVRIIHGSSFVYSALSFADGGVSHGIVFENEPYCFAPVQIKDPNFLPAPDCEIFVKGSNNEIYIYTENRGDDKFDKIIFE